MIVIIALLALIGLTLIVSAISNTPPLQVIQNWTKSNAR